MTCLAFGHVVAFCACAPHSPPCQLTLSLGVGRVDFPTSACAPHSPSYQLTLSLGGGWLDFPTIFVEAGLEIPYSVEGFDQAMQNNFKEALAVAFDMSRFRVKIVKIKVAALHGCEVFFSARVPGGDEAKAQLILAVTLEGVNMQLKQRGLNAALNFVGATRIVRKPCEAGKYRITALTISQMVLAGAGRDFFCEICPSNSSSPAGSVGIQACSCNAVSVT